MNIILHNIPVLFVHLLNMTNFLCYSVTVLFYVSKTLYGCLCNYNLWLKQIWSLSQFSLMDYRYNSIIVWVYFPLFMWVRLATMAWCVLCIGNTIFAVCIRYKLYDFRQQVQQQAALVVQENEVLLEKLDQQDEMMDKSHEEYHCKSKYHTCTVALDTNCWTINNLDVHHVILIIFRFCKLCCTIRLQPSVHLNYGFLNQHQLSPSQLTIPA